jgi:predicted porin
MHSARIASAFAVLLPAIATAAEDVEVYGRINVTLQNSDEAGVGQVELQNNASRVGVKGELPLNEGLKAIYQLEWGVDLDDQTDDTFTDRNQFVGLQGTFGTIRVGRHDTALKEAQGEFDLFDDLEGDIDRVFNGESRLRNYIGYVSPTFAGALTATVNFFPGEDAENGEDGLADSTSLALAYDDERIYAAIAHDRDIEGEAVETTRLVGGYTLGPARIMLFYQATEFARTDEDGFGGSLAWTFGDSTAKLQYLTADIWRLDPQPDPLLNRLDSSWSAGLDHKLGDKTKLFGFYTTGDIGGTGESNEYVAIGLEHNF